MTKLIQNTENQKSPKAFLPLWSYVNNKKRKIGFAYLTENGSLCIKGDPLLDKNQLGRLLVKGLYVFPND